MVELFIGLALGFAAGYFARAIAKSKPSGSSNTPGGGSYRNDNERDDSHGHYQ